MEACFSQLTLDVIGKSVFNYDFNSLNTDSPLIQVRSSVCMHNLIHALHALPQVCFQLWIQPPEHRQPSHTGMPTCLHA